MNDTPDYSRYVPPQKQESSRTWLYVLLGLIVAFLCCLLIAGVVVLVGGLGLFTVASTLVSESGELHETMDGYFRAMAARDAESALSYFSSRAGMSAEEIRAEFTRGGSRYEGFQSVTVTRFNTETANGSTTANIGGTVRYVGEDSAGFSAALRKEGDGWKLLALPDVDGSPPRVR